MTLQRIYDLCNFVVSKSVSGNTLTPDNFNDLLPAVSDIILNDELKKLVVDITTPIPDELLSTSILRPFRSNSDRTVLPDGHCTVPDDYVRWTSVLKGVQIVEVVSDHAAAIMQGNVFSRANVRRFCFPTGGFEYYVDANGKFVFTPIGSYTILDPVTSTYFLYLDDPITHQSLLLASGLTKKTGTGFRVIPYDTREINLRYIRKPKNAFYDYCTDNDYNLVYMPVGAYLIFDQGTQTYEMYVDDPVTHTSNVIASGLTKTGAIPGNTPSYTSLTTELEWEDRVHINIIAQILLKVGISLKEYEITKIMQENAQN